MTALAASTIVAALELAFANKALRKLCENEARAKAELGAPVAEKLKRRLADLVCNEANVVGSG